MLTTAMLSPLPRMNEFPFEISGMMTTSARRP
jgi:hypothetical protein